MIELVYPRFFFDDQVKRRRPAGTIVEELPHRLVRVEIDAGDLELLRFDAAGRANARDLETRMAAQHTLRAARQASLERSPSNG